MTKVSVIMPAYNAGKLISESIESVINQTFTDWELIIVDDGSTDNTFEVVNKYVNIDNRIKLYYQENGKQGKARNHAIAKSTGQYLAFLDADDLMLPHKLEYQLRDIKLTDADLVFSDSYVFNKLPLRGNETSFNINDCFYYGLRGLESFLIINRIPMLTVLVKKECIVKVGGFSEVKDVQNAEDYHLWLKLLLHEYKLFGSSQIISAYREHSLSVSNNDRLNEFEVLFVLKDLSETYKRVPDLIKINLTKRKAKFLKRIKNKDQYSFIVDSKRYLILFNRTKWRFRMLYYIERFLGRRFSFFYLQLITL